MMGTKNPPTTKAPAKKAAAKKTTADRVVATRATAAKKAAAKTTAATRKAAAIAKAEAARTAGHEHDGEEFQGTDKQAAAAAEITASTDRAERTALAKAEHKAVAEWTKAGRQGERPATPNLDAIREQAPNSDSTKASVGRKRPAAGGRTSTGRTRQTDDELIEFVKAHIAGLPEGTKATRGSAFEALRTAGRAIGWQRLTEIYAKAVPEATS